MNKDVDFILSTLLNIDLTEKERFREFCRYIYGNNFEVSNEIRDVLGGVYSLEWETLAKNFQHLGDSIISNVISINTYDPRHLLCLLKFRNEIYIYLETPKILIYNFIRDNINNPNNINVFELYDDKYLGHYKEYFLGTGYIPKIYDINALISPYDNNDLCYYYIGNSDKLEKIDINYVKTNRSNK